MDPNDINSIKQFVKSMEKANSIIDSINPDVVIAPMMGAVPFVDVLNIINDDFQNGRVEYVPASNKVHRVRDVMRGAFETIISDYIPDGGKIVSLDEVVSGNSAIRVRKQFDAAKMDYANKKTVSTFGKDTDFRDPKIQAFRDEICQKIEYTIIGIADSKMSRQGKQRTPEYEKLLLEKKVLEIPTPMIVTMDRVDFFPANYKTAEDSEGKTVFLPVIENFEITAEYLDFLKMVAGVSGKAVNEPTVCNLAKIQTSYQRVPKHLREIQKE